MARFSIVLALAAFAFRANAAAGFERSFTTSVIAQATTFDMDALHSKSDIVEGVNGAIQRIVAAATTTRDQDPLLSMMASGASLAWRKFTADANAASETGVVPRHMGSLLRGAAVQRFPPRRFAPLSADGRRRPAKFDAGIKVPMIPDKVPEVESVVWQPQKERYLLLFCSFGRLSNQIQCLKRSLRLAALLNRTLLVPPRNILTHRGALVEVWATDMVVDWRRMAQCLGPATGRRKAVMPVAEYLAKHPGEKKIKVERILCAATGGASTCAHPSLLGQMSREMGDVIEFPPLDEYPQWLANSPIPASPFSNGQLVAAFAGATDKILCVGELFSAPLKNNDRVGFNIPRPASCNNLWRPSRAIDRFAEVFVAKRLASAYAAVHLRRGDFYLESVLAKKENRPGSKYAQYSPIAEVAREVARRMDGANLTTLYVATDASRIELDLFQNIVLGSSKVTKVVTLDAALDDLWNRWRQNIWAHEIFDLAATSPSGIPWILADKGISSRADLFFGNPASSFSGDILDMRCNERLKRGPDSSSLVCTRAECKPLWC